MLKMSVLTLVMFQRIKRENRSVRPHGSPEQQFKSVNRLAQIYDWLIIPPWWLKEINSKSISPFWVWNCYWIPLPKDNMCQVQLKLTKWFWRRLQSPWKKGVAFHFYKVYLHSLYYFVQSLVEIDPGRFFNVFNVFLLLSPPWKRVHFIWSNLNPLDPMVHCTKFGWEKVYRQFVITWAFNSGCV